MLSPLRTASREDGVPDRSDSKDPDDRNSRDSDLTDDGETFRKCLRCRVSMEEALEIQHTIVLGLEVQVSR